MEDMVNMAAFYKMNPVERMKRLKGMSKDDIRRMVIEAVMDACFMTGVPTSWCDAGDDNRAKVTHVDRDANAADFAAAVHEALGWGTI